MIFLRFYDLICQFTLKSCLFPFFTFDLCALSFGIEKKAVPLETFFSNYYIKSFSYERIERQSYIG